MARGWIGVDLDGTLAFYSKYDGPAVIGDPVPTMLNRVKTWLSSGEDVRIFTARVSTNNPTRDISLRAIQDWCAKWIGQTLPITSEKDYTCREIWDDRCVQVVPNKGISIEEVVNALQ
jgi:hypothetical protein